MDDYIKRLDQIRKWLVKNGLHALIIPSGDPHQSEYVAEYWKAREWLTGFTGSAGVAIVTQDHAHVWTDSRYFLQAETELKDKPFGLMQKSAKTLGYVDWLKQHFGKGNIIGIDGQLVSESQSRKYENGFSDKGIEFLLVDDPFSEIWESRPSFPKTSIFFISEETQDRTRIEKIQFVRNHLTESSADAMIVTDLDEICWVLNIRGSDIQCNTSVVSYLVISSQSVDLFIDREKVPAEIQKIFENEGICLHTYRYIRGFIMAQERETKWLVDPAKCNASLFALLSTENVMEETSLIYLEKAIKTPLEVKAIKRTMLKDGVALTRAFMWLENTLESRSVSEDEFAKMIADFRSKQKGYFSESFPAIVGYQAHGAIVHYRPTKESASLINNSGMLLVDSGGHYESGTTDITRTIALSEPDQKVKAHYTAVLKGHIALASVVFPESTRGVHLDALARQHLWAEGLNYGHGTGHGVGFFSNVHEGPYGISPMIGGERNRPLKAGVLITNEPGFYLEGKYGIRIENMMLTVLHSATEHGKFLAFETLTWFPIDLACVDFRKLTRDEIYWINSYHNQVREQLIPLLSNPVEKFWMIEKTKPIPFGKIG